jgi:hypothetical protein
MKLQQPLYLKIEEQFEQHVVLPQIIQDRKALI